MRVEPEKVHGLQNTVPGFQRRSGHRMISDARNVDPSFSLNRSELGLCLTCLGHHDICIYIYICVCISIYINVLYDIILY